MTPHDLSSPPDDPFVVFDAWLAAARASEAIPYATAAALATVDEGAADARMVIVHETGPAGFVFATDARSPKVRQLRERPWAALVFYWGPLEVQVRVRGPVEPADEATADLIFARRPRRSQATAWASRQSESREGLEERMAAVEERFSGEETLPRPIHWRAYRLRPRTIELWRAGARRLHERVLYVATGDGWSHRCLEP